jgi:ketosteroid isomerase-like protein
MRWLEASNSGSIESMLDLYSEDAVHESPKVRAAVPGSDGKLSGKAAIRSWWQQTIGGTPGLKYELLNMTADASGAVIEYMRKAPGEVDLAVAESFQIRDGKIFHSVVYHF